MKKIFKKRALNFQIMRQAPFAYTLSILLIIVSLGAFFTRGLNYGIDFAGGMLIEASSSQEIQLDEIREQLSFLKDMSIQSIAKEGQYGVLIQAQPREGENLNALVNQVKGVLGSSYTYDQVEAIGPTIGEELKQKSFLASILALLAIAVYIWFRFEWPFAVGCLISLAHSLILVIGLFAIFQLDFNMIVVAGLLTLAGYACNDTIVTYDRLRENLKKFRKMPIVDLLDKSINETLSRTVLTSLTTLFVAGVLLFVGGESLAGFSLVMLLGIIFGTYSSIYLAVPMLKFFDVRGAADSDKE